MPLRASIKLQLDSASLARFPQELVERFEPHRQAIQNSMCDIFYETVQANFGNYGLDRPIEWPPLSRKYAKKVGRAQATLRVTGRLAGAVKTEYGVEASSVSISKDDVPYAFAHQFGSDKQNIPARPYFPIDANGEITPRTKADVMKAAETQLNQELKNANR